MASSGRALRARLSALGAVDDDGLDLGQVALTIANLDHLQAETGEYDDHLSHMAQSLTNADGCSAKEMAHILAATLTDIYGYQAPDTEDDESDLMDTIDTRRGCPETLGILALDIMTRAGWNAEALSFGPRFLVRLTDQDGSRILLDPAGGWNLVEAYHMRSWLKAQSGLSAEMDFTHMQALTNRGVLLRLQNGAKVRFLRSGHLEQALQTIETTLLFAPESNTLWREAGILHARLNHYADAVSALERFLDHCNDPSLKGRTLQILNDLRQRLTYQ
jgi:regulator of sirC expression with transglutaminase-like and TPR domain